MRHSVEFLLIRRTAQSKGGNPKNPHGGQPKYSAQDIQMIASAVRTLPAYYAVVAKTEGDELAALQLLEVAHIVSEAEWRANPRNWKTRHTLVELDRVSEVAVIKFLNPHDDEGKLRTEEWAAKYIGVSWPTWKKNFKDHQGYIEQRLDDFYQSGQQDIQRFVRDEAAPIEI